MNWDKYFMSMAYFVALRSKDESTKCGAVIVGQDNQIISTGYNSFVRGINDHVKERQERPYKYLWFEHGERNAIYNAALSGVSTKNCKIYVTGMPCADCARGIVQAGIKEVIIEERENFGEEWNDSQKAALQMFEESGTNLRIIKDDIQREIYKYTRGQKH